MTVRAPVPGPPALTFLVRVVLRRLVPEGERAALLSELCELWEQRVEREGEVAARRWYARQTRAYPLRLMRDRMRAWGSGPPAERKSAAERTDTSGVTGIMNDAKQALRSWVRSPGLALTIVLTVGLGLGASTAMFAVVRTVVMNPLPYDGSDRLMRIYHAISGNRWPISVADFLAIETQQTHFEAVAAYATGERTLTGVGAPERVRVRAVTRGWFDLVGLRAAQGRTFDETDGVFGGARTAVLSWGFWQRRFGGDASTVGRTIRLDEQDYTVIGVLPRAVGPFEERFDVFPALQFEPPRRKGPFMLTAVGRMRPGVDTAVASAELRLINKRIFSVWQGGWTDSTATWGIMPLDEFVVGRFRTILFVLLGAVGMVLLVASTNAASLLTARSIQRRTELATRAALGASGTRLGRLLITESVMLALGGAALSLVFATAAIRAVSAAGPDFMPRAAYVVLDGPVLGFAALLTVISLVVFGVIPAIQLLGSGSALAQRLRAGGRSATGDMSAQRVRRLLVAAQFAMAVPLLAGAALLLNSFLRLQDVDPGFDRQGVFTARVARAPVTPEEAEEALFFWDQLLERIRALPGVGAVGLNTGRPPRSADNINNFDPLDRPTPPGQTEPLAVWLVVSPGYFDAMRIPLLSGRMFDARDTPELSTTSALVDRAWANAIYPGESPVGKQMYEGGCRGEGCRIVEVIGVVDNVRYLGLDDSQSGAAVGTLYVPHSQWRISAANLFVRAQGDPLQQLGPIRRVVQELDPATPVTDVATAVDLVDDALAAPRNLAAVVIAFALVALILAMIGIYGVMSYFVQEHRKDIGVRLALGSKPSSVLALVLSRGMKPVLAGTVAGFAIAIMVSRFITRLLYGVTPNDPATLAIVALGMLITAVTACWLPARHAARMDPAQVLRLD